MTTNDAKYSVKENNTQNKQLTDDQIRKALRVSKYKKRFKQISSNEVRQAISQFIPEKSKPVTIISADYDGDEMNLHFPIDHTRK